MHDNTIIMKIPPKSSFRKWSFLNFRYRTQMVADVTQIIADTPTIICGNLRLICENLRLRDFIDILVALQ